MTVVIAVSGCVMPGRVVLTCNISQSETAFNSAPAHQQNPLLLLCQIHVFDFS